MDITRFTVIKIIIMILGGGSNTEKQNIKKEEMTRSQVERAMTQSGVVMVMTSSMQVMEITKSTVVMEMIL